MSLLDVLRGVMLDPAEQAVYEADPRAYLQQYGYDGVDPTDLSEAFGLVADTLPADQAMAAYLGDAGPEVSSIGEDTTDFDEPPAVDDGGPADVDVVDLGPRDVDARDLDDGDGSDDDLDADDIGNGDPGDGADLADRLDGHFGEGHDALDADEPFEVDSFSWGDSNIGTFGHAADADELTVDGDDDLDGAVAAADIGSGHLPPDDGPGLPDDGSDDVGADTDDLGDHFGDLAVGDPGDGTDAPDLGDDPDELDIGSF